MANYTIYTDGGCRDNAHGLYGGWAFIILNERRKVIKKDSGACIKTTNNIMELTAIINACKHIPNGKKVVIISDSKYAIGVLSGKWNANKNVELIESFKPTNARLDIQFKWVKGHDKSKYNNACDKMASEAIDKLYVSENPHLASEDNGNSTSACEKQPYSYTLYVAARWPKNRGGYGVYSFVLLNSNMEIIARNATVSKDNISVLYLKAIIEGCGIVPYHKAVCVISDSEYAVNVLTGKWNGKMNRGYIIQCWKQNERIKASYQYTEQLPQQYLNICNVLMDNELDQIAGKNLKKTMNSICKTILLDEAKTRRMKEACARRKAKIAAREQMMREDAENMRIFNDICTN